MSKVYDFIKESGVFYVLTANNNTPFGRPFGAIMEHNDKLYISTSDTKQVYHQIKENANIQLLAFRPDAGSWVRVSGTAIEITGLPLKQMMLNACPVLNKHFASADAPHYNLFEITITYVEYH